MGIRKIDNQTKAKMKADYLMGMSIRDIASKYGYSEIEVANIRTKSKWVKQAEILDAKINASLEEKIIEEKLRILEKLHTQSEIIIDRAFDKLKLRESYDPVPILDGEGNEVGEKTNYRELKSLADVWNLGYSRLLRSVNEPDTVRAFEEQTSNSGDRPVIQVLLNVGIKQTAMEKITGKAQQPDGKKKKPKA